MKFLFLGRGKVNTSIASFVAAQEKFQPADILALVENKAENGGDDANVSVSRLEAGVWREISIEPGNFDSFRWPAFLPASVFISPGVDPRRPFFKWVQKYEIRELDFFGEFFEGEIFCVTGTDGKSTTTLQCGEILKRALAGKRIFVGGNLGIPTFAALDPVQAQQKYDLAILEISSFQAERLKSFRPDWALLLNLDRDHLDRYDQLSDYFQAKWNLLRRAQQVFFPADLQSPPGLQSSMVFHSQDSLLSILKSLTSKLGTELGFNIRPELFEKLPTLPHRLERWCSRERLFVNDSKATTVHATLYGLEQIQRERSRLQLILGGHDKGDDFSRLVSKLRPDDQVLIYGEAREKISRELAPFSGIRRSFTNLKTLLEEVLPALGVSDTLLLSPGCASYDEFENFEERGKFFRNELQKRFTIERVLS